jgi:methyl-accepting chemotaxis protein
MQANQPFFTNTIEGAIKFFGSLIALGAVIIGIVVKMGQTKFADDVNQAKIDNTELGKKVDKLDKDCIGQTGRVDALESRHDKMDVVMAQVLLTQGEHKSGIAGLTSQMTSLQHDITMLITESAARMQESVHQLALKVERLDASKEERDRLGRSLEKMLAGKSVHEP